MPAIPRLLVPALCSAILLAIGVTSCSGFPASSAWAKPKTTSQKQPLDGGAPAAQENAGPPVCVRVGTKSEGWAWPNGHFIHWWKCKGVVPKCEAARPGQGVEGWYAHGTLIAPDDCSQRKRKR